MKYISRALAVIILSFAMLFSFTPIGSFAATTDEGTLQKFCENTGVAGAKTTICKINEQGKDGKDGRGLLEENGIFRKVIRLISWITGLLAGVFIIVGGIKLAMSRGEADSVKSARNTIIYSCVGIFVILISNLIINFVLSIVAKTNS